MIKRACDPSARPHLVLEGEDARVHDIRAKLARQKPLVGALRSILGARASTHDTIRLRSTCIAGLRAGAAGSAQC